MELVDPGIRQAVRARRIEAIAFGLLAALPVVPYVTSLLRRGVPRFSVFGDIALLEQASRHVMSGDTLLGPGSRFGWNHPGPLFFYFAAPFVKMFGGASTGLYLATCLVNALAAGSIVASARVFARRAHSIAALMVVLAWFMAFGSVVANPWSPLVIVLPLLAFLLSAALFARGKSGAAYPCVFFGALALQHHVATASTVLVASVIALIAFFVGARRRGLEPNEGWRLAVAAALLVIVFVPTLVEQLVAPKGNLTKVVSFFLHRQAPLKPLDATIMNWTRATSWLPDRVLSHALVEEGAVPLMMRFEAMPIGISTTARTIAIAYVVLTAICAIVAARRRDVASLSILAFAAMTNAVAVTALQAIVGVSYPFLAFWTTATSCLGWIGILSTVFSAGGAMALRVPRMSGIVAPGLIVVGLSVAVTATSLQHNWLSRHPSAAGTRPEMRADFETAYRALEKRLDGSSPVLHGAPEIAAAIELELDKDGVSGPRKLHVYIATPEQPVAFASCLELVSKTDAMTLHASTSEVSACP